jgi:acetolactate synthase-1/2/3 large subunit
MRVADAIFDRLKSETDFVFFVPGGAAMFLVDALGKSGIKHISALSEQGAGVMALGYAMATGKLGVVLTISGAGATNAITPCLAAWSDSVPVLFISGQTRTENLTGGDLRTYGGQPGPIIEMVRPITKFCHEFGFQYDNFYSLNYAIEQCLSGRKGPCWLSIPQDVQAMEVER